MVIDGTKGMLSFHFLWRARNINDEAMKYTRLCIQDAAADDDDDDDMPPHEVLPDQDDETDNNNDVVSGALSFVGNASPHSPIRHSSVQQRQELVSPPSPLPPAAGAVTSPVPSKPNNGRSTSAESLSAALASAAGDLEANPSLIAEDGPSGAVNATREERAALHALQEQVRQAAWATAGFRYASIRSSCSPTNRAAASAASKEREGEKESGDDVEWLKLAQLVETRSAFVATTRAGAINRLAALRKQAITPKVREGKILGRQKWRIAFESGLPLIFFEIFFAVHSLSFDAPRYGTSGWSTAKSS